MFISDFLGTVGSFSSLPILTESFDILQVADCSLSKIEIDINKQGNDSIPVKWDYTTILLADFDKDLFGGNLKYATEHISHIKIKKRFKNEFEWQTIYEKPILKDDDFNVELYDYLEPSNTTIEYCFVPVYSSTGLEGGMTMSEVLSEFDGYFLIEKDRIFRAYLNTENSKTLNRETTTQTTLGRKYPFIIANGMSNYYSGTLQATFLPLIDCEFTLEKASKYENNVDEFLSDNKPKILKDFMGNIWIVNIVNNISRKNNDPRIAIHSIDWVEIGNAKSVVDLYNNNLLSVELEEI